MSMFELTKKCQFLQLTKNANFWNLKKMPIFGIKKKCQFLKFKKNANFLN